MTRHLAALLALAVLLVVGVASTRASASVDSSLQKKLDVAIASFGRGNVHATCGQLGALGHEASAQSGKRITEAEGTALQAAAEATRTALAC